MKRCTKEHVDKAFGVIPVGSLWEDDSPYARAAKNFEKVVADPDPDDEGEG